MPPTDILLDALIDFYEDRTAIGNEAQPMLRRILARLNDAKPRTASTPRQITSTRHWEDIQNRQGLSAFPNLNAALAAISPLLNWRQNPNYSDELMGDGYMDNYGYAELVGGDASFFDAEDIRCGLFLLGPDRHYPKHHHAAEEVYNVLASEASLWRRGDEAWRSYPLGTPIYHPPWIVHETKTGPDPLLALYSWYGESANAVLLQDAGPKT